MKNILTFISIFIIALLISSFQINSDTALKVEQKVEDLLSQMTLEEKIGQMTQVTIQAVSKTQGTKTQKHELDLAKLEEAITKYHVGSLLNVYDVAHSVDYWHEILTAIADITAKNTRLKIPVIYGIDAIHGATYTQGATLFPQAINMAATFNKELMKRSGEITSIEVRASGIPWNFYPVMDIGRQPLWPRLWETLGEDVYLASQMGRSYIEGAQGSNYGAPDKVATCLKHYVGYSFPINGKDRTPAWISERMLREYFLPSFEEGIKAGAPSIMVNSAEVDGIPTHSDYYLLTEVLRGELNFKGFVVSDWEDIKRLYTRDKVADSPKEAVRMAVMAGVDMSMVPYDFSFYDLMLELVNEGSIPVSRIDEAVSRILKVKYELGLFENSYPDKSLKNKIGSEEFTKANLESAIESIVLVKNQSNILPLKKDAKLLVTGPTADMLSVMNGGWTITWQGNEESLYPKEKKTVLKALQEKFGQKNITFVEGSSFDKNINTPEAVDAAKNADAIILCLGEKAYCETPGNIDDLTLDKAQLNLAEAMIKTGKPVILIMLEGRPRIINKIVDEVDAVLIGFLPGMEGGLAIAEILSGDANPSGKLPVTYPKFPNAIMNYDYKPLEFFDGNAYNPQWPFGFGLSYTTFQYSGLELDKNSVKNDEEIKVSVTVKNSGKIIGKEAVQLYLSDLVGTVSRPVKQLKGFEKISLAPGESKTIEFVIKPEHLSFIGRDNKRIIEKGEFKVTIADLEKNFRLN
jgi:beta-glucosidase